MRSHGMSKTSTYKSWKNMKERCYLKTRKDFHLYGGRGIAVCDRWFSSFESFLADMGERPDGASLDRVDANGNYEPGNCKWATRSEQRLNQRSVQAIVGRTYGLWTVVALGPKRRWHCKCACGTERAVLATSLNGGLSKSCGCRPTGWAAYQAKRRAAIAKKLSAVVSSDSRQNDARD